MSFYFRLRSLETSNKTCFYIFYGVYKYDIYIRSSIRITRWHILKQIITYKSIC
jgi:hypothetical protein